MTAGVPGLLDRHSRRRWRSPAAVSPAWRALDWLLSKQDAQGRCKYGTCNGKMWADVEQKGQPSKWVALRALRVLKRAEEDGFTLALTPR
jgi:hypothetical protein